MLNDIYHALDPVAFQIGPLVVHWYGLGYIFGILIGALLFYLIAKRWSIKIPLEAMLTMILAGTLGIFLGARIGFILFYNLEYYIAHPLEVFAVYNGGMSFHGGVLGMVIAVAIASRILKIPLLTLGDLIVIVAPIGIFLVRFTNFINGELWGSVTDVPWGVVFEAAGSQARHPSQLYEAFLEGIVLFVVLFAFSRRVPPRPRGFFAGVFFTLYGVFRIAVEFVREPDVQIGYLLGTDWLTTGMVLSIPMVLAGIAFFIFAYRRKLPQQGPKKKLAT